jgi:hypothetical protein
VGRRRFSGGNGGHVAALRFLGSMVCGRANDSLVLAFLSHRIICKHTDANCSLSPTSILGYRIHREAITLSYLSIRTRINVANTY